MAISPLVLMLSGMLAGAAPCESLKSLTLPNTTITSAQLVAAGPMVVAPAQGPPGGPVAPNAAPPAAGRGRGAAPAPPPVVLPAHCRIAAVLAPSPDSHIEMEV